MASRNIMHRNKLADFKTWLGEKALPPVGEWECVRWRGKPGQPMRIIFDNSRSCEHLSCNDAAVKDVFLFINQSRAKKNLKGDINGTQTTTIT